MYIQSLHSVDLWTKHINYMQKLVLYIHQDVHCLWSILSLSVYEDFLRLKERETSNTKSDKSICTNLQRECHARDTGTSMYLFETNLDFLSPPTLS